MQVQRLNDCLHKSTCCYSVVGNSVTQAFHHARIMHFSSMFIYTFHDISFHVFLFLFYSLQLKVKLSYFLLFLPNFFYRSYLYTLSLYSRLFWILLNLTLAFSFCYQLTIYKLWQIIVFGEFRANALLLVKIIVKLCFPLLFVCIHSSLPY